VKVQVLGCHGSDQLVEAEAGPRACRTCGFLVNDSVLVDAGTVGSVLLLSEQKRIRQILLSHLHFDHVKGLPTLADNLVGEAIEPVLLRSIPEVLDGLREYVFNNALYPNFLALPDPDHPVFACQPLDLRRETEVCGLAVTPIPVNHLVPTVGFLLRQGASTILYSGDTYQTEEIWKVAAHEPTLKAAFIETSFPDELTDLARASRHLTPATFAQEFGKIGRPDLPVFVYHMKPRFRDQIQRQLARLKIPNLRVLEEGQEISF
jgi:ribonuclease BN (tRNA processing enzyme)